MPYRSTSSNVPYPCFPSQHSLMLNRSQSDQSHSLRPPGHCTHYGPLQTLPEHRTAVKDRFLRLYDSAVGEDAVKVFTLVLVLVDSRPRERRDILSGSVLSVTSVGTEITVLLGHDAGHGSLYSQRHTNDVVGFLLHSVRPLVSVHVLFTCSSVPVDSLLRVETHPQCSSRRSRIGANISQW